MKKMLLIALTVMAFMLTGCKEKAPEYQLDLTGTVIEQTTNITTHFKVATRNVDNLYFRINTTYPKLVEKEYPDAYEWVREKTFANVPNGAVYDIVVTGYIEWHGIKLSIDEHWKNPE